MVRNLVTHHDDTLALPVADGTVAGDPVAVSLLPGVALQSPEANGLATVDRTGVYRLDVQAVDDDGAVAVAVGDALYLTPDDTPALSKKVSGVYFGHALDPMPAGETATIRVLNRGGGHAHPAAASGGGSAEAPLALETPVGEDSIPLTLTGQPDQEEPLFRVVDSASDDDKLFEVFGYKSGSFLVARDFFRHEFLEVLATADGHVGEITINSGTNDTVLRSRAADTQLSLNHDRIVVGNGGATDRIRLEAGKVIYTKATAAPADVDLTAGCMALWLDQTNGAAKLMVKAKQADGTVVTGSVNLSA